MTATGVDMVAVIFESVFSELNRYR